jgi:hypothetical protein
MTDLRTVSVDLFNDSIENPAVTMTVSNAQASQGTVVTPSSDFPMNIENNGGNAQVDFSASSARQGSIGQVLYVIQNKLNCSIAFSNTMSKRKTKFIIGNGGPSFELADNGTHHFTFQEISWSFTTQSNGENYVINATVA